ALKEPRGREKRAGEGTAAPRLDAQQSEIQLSDRVMVVINNGQVIQIFYLGTAVIELKLTGFAPTDARNGFKRARLKIFEHLREGLISLKSNNDIELIEA